MSSTASDTVIIVGAGPVGLVTASLLVEQGIPVVLVEASKELPHDLRASTFHPPTLDMLERFGVVDTMIEQGLICPTWQFRDRKEGVVAEFELSYLKSDTHHPYRLQCEQWRLGELLYAALKTNPLATLRFSSEAIAARQNSIGVEVDLKNGSGGIETLGGSFLVGADGISSVVRKAMGIGFDGFTIPEIFLTISTTFDFRQAMPDIANIAYISDPDQWFVLNSDAAGLAGALSCRRGVDRRGCHVTRTRPGIVKGRAAAREEFRHCPSHRISRSRARGIQLHAGPDVDRGRCRPRQQSIGRDGA